MQVDLQVQTLFEMGFLPFPGQTEEAYQKLALEKIDQHKAFQSYIKKGTSDRLFASYELEPPLSYFQAIWRVHPYWATALYSSASMSLFHLGALCAESFEGKEIYFIQIHSRMTNKDSFWGYKKDMIFVHEMIHLLRLGIDKGSFEEFIAYDSDPSAIRRFLGPFFSSAWMPAVFMAQIWGFFLGALWYLDFFVFSTDLPALLFYTLLGLSILSLLPWMVFLKKAIVWFRFQKKIKSSPWAALRRVITLGLHEKEIYAFSSLEVEKWKKHVEGLDKDLYQKRLKQWMC